MNIVVASVRVAGSNLHNKTMFLKEEEEKSDDETTSEGPKD